LDADLIFLASIISSKISPQIYLLREKNFLDSTKSQDELIYFDIKSMIYHLKKEINKIYQNKYKRNISKSVNILDDFVVICFFIGNDFIPHPPSIDIKTNAIDYMLSKYVICLKKFNKGLVKIDDSLKETNINQVFLKEWLFEIVGKYNSHEKYYFTTLLPKFLKQNRIRKVKKMKEEKMSGYEKEIYCLDNLINQPFSSPISRSKYYQKYFKINIYYNESIDNICREFLKGVDWCLQYYYFGCVSWAWMYPYNKAPMISDLCNYLNRNSKYNINKIKYLPSKNISIMNQLLLAVPPVYSNLLPVSYQYLMTSSKSPVSEMFPIENKIDTDNKYLWWKCDVDMPILNNNRIVVEINKLKLTKLEIIRDQILKASINEKK
jgi:5'-3' exonuclease